MAVAVRRWRRSDEGHETLTASFDEAGALLIALGWFAALLAGAIVLFRRTTRPAIG